MSAAPATARLFAALELPGELRDALGAWGAAAAERDPALRAVPAGQLHLTLHFLGERPLADVAPLTAAIESAPDTPVPLRAAGALWLAPRRPHVLTCAIDDTGGGAGRLHVLLAGALAAATPGWTAERRPLRPHVTVARVRRGLHPRTGDLLSAPGTGGDAPALVLVRSRLGPGGARHEQLARRTLRRSS